MSRSYKKIPILKCCGDKKYGKRQANRKVRRSYQNVLLKGKQYRKLYETWDINDMIQYWSRRDAERHGDLDIWKKWYFRK